MSNDPGIDDKSQRRIKKAQAEAAIAEAKAKKDEAKAKSTEAKARAEIARQRLKNEKTQSRQRSAISILKFPKIGKIFIAIVVLVLIVAAIAIIPGILSSNKGVTVSVATLKEAVNISKLSTAEFTYNGIADKTDENGNIEYHIYYKGTAKAGIDMNQIDFSIDENTKKITISIPPITISNPIVDESSVEYLPSNANVELRDVIATCKTDLQNEITANPSLLETSETNLKSTLEALLLPIIGDQGYTIDWNIAEQTLTEFDSTEPTAIDGTGEEADRETD